MHTSTGSSFSGPGRWGRPGFPTGCECITVRCPNLNVVVRGHGERFVVRRLNAGLASCSRSEIGRNSYGQSVSRSVGIIDRGLGDVVCGHVRIG